MNRQQRRAQAKKHPAPPKAPSAAPGLVEAMLAHRAGRLAEALVVYERILAAEPGHGEALQFAATARLQLGQGEAAVTLLRRLTAAHPGHRDGWLNLGGLLQEQGRAAEAEPCLRRALALAPDSVAAHANLALALRDLDRLGEAEDMAERASRLAPDDKAALIALGDVRRLRQNIDGALAAYRRVIARAPDNAALHKNLGAVLVAAGALGEAETVLRRAIALRPDLIEAHRVLLDLDTPPAAKAADAQALEAVLPAVAVGDPQRIEACFALGTAYDALGDADRAFPWFLEANRLKRATLNYDLAEDMGLADRTIALFTPDFMASRAGWGVPDERPVFVVGMPRSSTTLVEQILASHSAVHGAGELSIVPNMVQGFKAGASSYPDLLADLNEAAIRRLGEVYLAQAGRDVPPQARRVTDKMPLNARHLGLMRLMLPRAAILHCRKHPADTCLSCFFKLFTLGQPFSYDLAEVGRFFRHVYWRTMEHWSSLLGEAILHVDHRALVEDQEGQTRRLLAHCGLAWEDGCLDFHATQRPVWTASAAQVRRPINRRGVDRWRRYERHLGPLLAALGPLAEAD